MQVFTIHSYLSIFNLSKHVYEIQRNDFYPVKIDKLDANPGKDK